MNRSLNIGTFNVRSIQSKIRKEQLVKDTENYNLDILCIQETKIQNGVDTTINGARLICFPTDCRFYGCGFLINRKWIGNIHRTWKVSDRICVLQLICDINKPPTGQGKTNLLSLINVYAPTAQRSEQFPDEKETFYNQLSDTIDKLGNKTFLYIAGDLNAKIGRCIGGETCVGRFSRGQRNENGQTLIQLCEEKKLFISNSAFDHPARHQTTWVGLIKDRLTGNTKHIFNQIDYIICQQRHKHLLTNARSYGGTLLTSDHKLVKTSLKIEKYRLWRKHECSEKTPKINIANIFNTDHRIKFQQTLDAQLQQRSIDDKNISNDTDESLIESVAKKLKSVQSTIKQVGQECLGVISNTRHGKQNDEEISTLSKQQRDLRIQIQNTKTENERRDLKSERNKILHTIRKRQIKLSNEETEKKIENINNATCDHAMFKATKLLNQKQFENPKVEDLNGKFITNPDKILEIVATHFKSKFEDKTAEDILLFQGEAKCLNTPITPEEVRKSFNALSNNKAPGEDEVNAELLKYGTPLLDQTIADIFNAVFTNHENIDINTGVLIAIQKPGKKKGPPCNLRPITLLNSLRKALSIITLNRIRPQIEEYLSKNQSGFRPNRGTTDVVWTHKWILAKALKEDVSIKITGIDMSAAFDTINRTEILDILNPIVDEDEIRIVRFLLSNTIINTRINSASSSRPFVSNVGTPQGDSLSPVLFTIYLENALRDVRSILPKPQNSFEKELPNEVAYADDVDFIGNEYADINEIQTTLEKHQLTVNTTKTEFTTLTRNEEEWKKSKKVGSLIGDHEDVERRKLLSITALNKLNHVWIKGKKLKLKTKVHLYKSLVKSILLYNCSTWALTQTEEEKLNAFHRKQLRKVLNIKYPVKITNKSLYKKTQEKPISLQILEARWNLFGHILRRDKDIPANKSMRAYFVKCGNKFRGRPITTLPIVLNRDLALINHTHQLHSLNDLEKITALAKNRRKWRKLTKDIGKAAEASQTENWDASRQ